MDVISVLLGIPEEDRDPIREATDLMLARDPETGAMHPEAPAAAAAARELMIGLLHASDAASRATTCCRSSQRSSTPTSTVQTKTLTDAQAMGFINLLSAAGHETTAKLLGNAVVLLALHPDQRRLLWDEPGRIPTGAGGGAALRRAEPVPGPQRAGREGAGTA